MCYHILGPGDDWVVAQGCLYTHGEKVPNATFVDSLARVYGIFKYLFDLGLLDKHLP